MTDPAREHRQERREALVRRPSLYPLITLLGRPLLRLIFALLGGFAVEGRAHIPRTGGVLIVVNHISYADPPALGLACPRPLWFMANQNLFEIPILGWVLSQALAFPVAKDVIVERAALRRAEAILRSGDALGIFPEGGTTPDARLTTFYSGASLVALRTGVPIIPAGISGTQRVMPNLSWVPRYGRGGVRVRFGPPLPTADMPASLSRREQADWLAARMWEGIAALLPPEHLPPRPLMNTKGFAAGE
ncbi:MAG: 1-acyl-sn-glycerol-3-phosphate acyltransferase [Armatimonadetes bacterium]|nr:1-acyl-sn-glycerol-3-phosphate acyltransferase [Armatimonadota bacterium]